MARNSWYKWRQVDSMVQNKMKIKDKEIVLTALFSRKLKLKVCLVYVKLTNFRLDRNKQMTEGYSAYANKNENIQ